MNRQRILITEEIVRALVVPQRFAFVDLPCHPCVDARVTGSLVVECPQCDRSWVLYENGKALALVG